MDSRAYFAAAATLVGAGLLWTRSRRVSHLPLPPGPKADPFIGALRSFPADRWFECFSGWQKLYGDMIYLNVIGTQFIILNSLDIATELCVKRGNIHSGRPMDTMNYKVMGWDWNVVIAQPGSFHSDCRTVFKQGIGQQEVLAHDGVIQEECHKLITALNGFQGDAWEEINGAIGAIVIRITFGDSIYKSIGKELTELNRETLELVTRVSTQFWLVNFIPSLHRLPDWLPLPFKKVGRYGYELQEKMHLWPWAETVKHYEAGIAEPSIALDCLESKENLDVARDALGMMYSAGVDNTASTLMSFVAMMLLHPEVQKKAQQEMDRELGMGSPTISDRSRLHYMDACWRESVRMNPSTALGVPHLSTEDDVYKGVYIPKGCWLLTNIGFMCRDPRIWGDPDVYRPERWMLEHNPDARSLPDVDDITFGFGRRICPGQFLATNTNFTFAASLLKTYDILPVPGETVPKEFIYTDAIIRRPESFKCYFRPRHLG